MNFLIVLPEGDFTITSSGLFSHQFVSQLAESHCVDIIGYKLPKNYLFKYKSEDVNIREWFYLSSSLAKKNSPKNNLDVKFNNTKRVSLVDNYKKIIKHVMPDFMALGLLDISNLEKISINNDYDFIISMSDPKSAHYLAIFLKRKIKCLNDVKLIQFWGDPWFHDITKKTNILDRYIESYLLKKSELIFYRSKPTLKLQKRTFPESSHKMSMIHRGFSGDLITEYSKSILLDSLCFVYAGDYHPNIRDIVKFSSAASRFGHSMTIAGSSSEECTKKLSKIPNVFLYDRLPPNDLEDIYAKADCIVIVLNKTGTQIPGKIYDLIPFNVPIILLMDGDLTEVDIPMIDRYIVVENNVSSIERFFSSTKEIEVTLDSRCNIYHVSEVVQDFVSILNKGFSDV